MNSSNIKVSIIMPTYNVEPYFRQAMESVLRQSLKEIEIIPVDDGSPDNCGQIMDEYAEKDSRVKPVHKENGGYGSAVNAGIKAAVGEYIAIMEPDDYVIDDLYYILYSKAKDIDLDICRFNSYYEVREHMRPMIRYTYYPGAHEILSEKQRADMFAATHAGVWMGIYRRSMLIENNIQLDEDNKAYHDVDFVPLVYLTATRIKILETCGYFYRRDVPTQSVNDIGKAYCIVAAVNRLWQEISSQKLTDYMVKCLYGYCVGHLFHYYHRVRTVYPSSPLEDILKKEIEKYILSQKGFVLSAEIFARISKRFGPLSNATALNIPKLPELKSYVPINKIRYDGACSLVDVLILAYMKLAIFISDPNPKNMELALKDLWPLLVGTVNVDNDLMRTVVKSILGSIPQADLLWHKHYIYVRLISYLIESGDISAIEHFWACKNVNEHIEADIYIYPDSVSRIVERKGPLLGNKTLLYALKRFDANEERFREYITGKAVAVVGNSPCELGLGKGREIDDHDIVIRFNNYVIDDKTVSDYGAKENVWALSPDLRLVVARSCIAKYDFLITSTVGRECPVKNMEYYIKLVEYMPFFRMNCQYDVREKMNLVFPSLGMYTLLYLSRLAHLLKSIHIYGFSLTDHYSGARHYYSSDPNAMESMPFHNWFQERRLLDELKYKFEGGA